MPARVYFKRNNTIHARATVRQSDLLHPPAVSRVRGLRSQKDLSITMVELFLTNYYFVFT